jgi:hypothetical protein
MLAATGDAGKSHDVRRDADGDLVVRYDRCAFDVSMLGNNVGTMKPKHWGKRVSGADQKAGRINKNRRPGPVCKTSIPGSNPGGASKLT